MRPLPLWEQDPLGRFRARARDYLNRPSYPRAAFDTLLEGLGPPSRVRAADVGAGTGIASLLLAERGVTVVAIEPNAAMRSAAPSHPRVRKRGRPAERTGLPRSSVDLVLCAQSFHWFDPARALPEFRRILRPRGRLAILWNERVERDPFSAAYGRLLRSSAEGTPTEAGAAGLVRRLHQAGFRRVRRRSFPHMQPLTREGLLGQARSVSYVPRRGPAAAALRRGLEAFHARFADDDGLVRLRYRAVLYVAAPPRRRVYRTGSKRRG